MMWRVLAFLAFVAVSGCGTSLAELKPLIDTCKVQRVEYIRAGTFVVVPRPGTHRTSDGIRQANEHRIEYDGDRAKLHEALVAAEPRCGTVLQLIE